MEQSSILIQYIHTIIKVKGHITDVVVILLRASLENLPNGYICLSTAERQSLASKTRRNIGVDQERIGKKPDVMGLVENEEKINEILYFECSRITQKKADNSMKLWRETLDGLCFVGATCRLMANQFGVVGVQVAGTVIYLNILVKGLGGIPRYFHLGHAEIPLMLSTQQCVNSLVDLF
ncbi:hypothetical protein F8M41_008514 [Gigaspora margarita]|uniref:Uncharacterized protein n=1 Tax=Gigaspora margarita TaxID=4874 RepID=A0A8H4B4B8_GIGMA|nr:hypothetical protein F8M41_008514 [Gigaspora margarita]